MKNLKLILMAGLLFAGQVLGNAGSESTTYTLIVNQSHVEWIGTKIVGSHNGTIEIQKGQLAVYNGKLTAASLTMDMRSIKNTDLKDPGYNKKLVGHLKSDDFFGVEKYPKAYFKAVKFVPAVNAGPSQNNYMVFGELTIKGITQKIEFPATVILKQNKLLVEGKLVFDRSKFNVRYGSSSFFDSLGNKAIDDDIQLNFSLIATSTTIN